MSYHVEADPMYRVLDHRPGPSWYVLKCLLLEVDKLWDEVVKAIKSNDPRLEGLNRDLHSRISELCKSP